MLETVNAESLRYFLKTFGYKNVAKLKKEEAYALTIEFLKKEDGISKVLKLLNLDGYKHLTKLLKSKNEGIKVKFDNGVCFLIGCLFAQHNDQDLLQLEKEMYEMIKDIDIKQYEKYAIVNQELEVLCELMKDLYGIVTIEDIIKTLKMKIRDCDFVDVDHVEALVKDRMIHMCEIKSYQKVKYLYYSWIDAEWFKDLFDRHEMIERKKISYKELMKYKDKKMIVNGKSKPLFQYLCKYTNPMEALKIEAEIILYAQAGILNNYLSELIATVQKVVPIYTEQQAMSIVKMIMDLHNDTVLWENNGFTPNELMKKELAKKA